MVLEFTIIHTQMKHENNRSIITKWNLYYTVRGWIWSEGHIIVLNSRRGKTAKVANTVIIHHL